VNTAVAHVGKQYPYLFERDLQLSAEFPYYWPQQFVYTEDLFNIATDGGHARFGKVSGVGLANYVTQQILWRINYTDSSGFGGRIDIRYLINGPNGPGGTWRIDYNTFGRPGNARLTGVCDSHSWPFFGPHGGMGLTSTQDTVAINTSSYLVFPFGFWNMYALVKPW
jgi:hypothetical protein